MNRFPEDIRENIMYFCQHRQKEILNVIKKYPFIDYESKDFNFGKTSKKMKLTSLPVLLTWLLSTKSISPDSKASNSEIGTC